MRKIIGLLLFSLALSPALAEDAIPYATVKDWGVFIDTSIGGCFIMTTYTQGEIVRIGISRTWKNGYIMIANEKWRSIERGKEYKLTFTFDADSPWGGTFTATNMGPTTVLLNGFTNAKFLTDFAAKNLLVITYGDTLVTRLPLTGSYAAVQSMVECQQKVDAVAEGQADPFAKVQRPPVQPDPFAGPKKLPTATNDPFKM
jgi:hypothetical protein